MILTIDLEDLSLTFRVLDTPIADLWLERMSQRHAWPMDDAHRFYGFNHADQDAQHALTKIQECVTTINAWKPMIQRPLTTVHDQDTLNYLHSIFEQWHGLLDQQQSHVPAVVAQALSDLNVGVHRCESVARGNLPRFVCTWFGMPKTCTLPLDIMQRHGTFKPAFGSVCLNYAEIGKTLEDLTYDRDNYISQEAFQPFHHYSADFAVRMYEESDDCIKEKLTHMKEYYNQHKDFFFEHGYTTFQDPRLLPLRFPVAQLECDLPREHLIATMAQRQCITKVTLQ